MRMAGEIPVPLAVAMLVIVGGASCVAQGTEPLLPKHPTKEEAALIAKLAGNVTLGQTTELHDIADLMEFMSRPLDALHVGFVLVSREAWWEKASLDIRDTSLRDALKALAGPRGNYAVIGNCICLGSAEDVKGVIEKRPIIPENPSKADAQLCRSLKETLVAGSFQHVKFPLAMDMLGSQADHKIVVDEKAVAGLRVNARRMTVNLGTALRVLCGADLNYGIRDGTIYVSTDEGLKKMMGRR